MTPSNFMKVTVPNLLFKTFCAALCLFLFLGAIGMLGMDRYYDASFSSLSLIVTAYLFNKPPVKSFLIIISVFAVICFLVGTYDNIDL